MRKKARALKVPITIGLVAVFVSVIAMFAQDDWSTIGDDIGDLFTDIVVAIDDAVPGGGGSEPSTTIASGPTEGSVINTATANFTYTSDTGGVTYECNLDDAGWSACSATDNRTVSNKYHVLQVRAVNAGTPDSTPASRKWTAFICSGTNVKRADHASDAAAGSALVTAVETTAAANTKVCVYEGDYDVPSTVTVNSGIDVYGQPGPTMKLDTTATGIVEVPVIGAAYPVDVTDGTLEQVPGSVSTSCTVPSGELKVIFDTGGTTSGANQMEWIGIGGSDAQEQGGTNHDPCGGTGVGLQMGTWVEPTISWMWFHDHGLQGTGTTDGIVTHSVFNDNGLEQYMTGFGAGSEKTVTEYEWSYNFSFQNIGNGQWCDHSNNWPTYTQETNGCYVHHNIAVDNTKGGYRFEYWPRFTGTLAMTNAIGQSPPTCTAQGVTQGAEFKNDSVVGYAGGGTSCHHYPASDEDFTHADWSGAVYENNYAAGNGSNGGFAFQAAQNALMYNNRCGTVTLEEIPASMVGATLSRPQAWSRFGPTVPDRTFGNNANNRCVNASDSDKGTDTWNNEIRYTMLSGENGGNDETLGTTCTSYANTRLYCHDNVTSSGAYSGDDAADTANDWNLTNNGAQYQTTKDGVPWNP